MLTVGLSGKSGMITRKKKKKSCWASLAKDIIHSFLAVFVRKQVWCRDIISVHMDPQDGASSVLIIIQAVIIFQELWPELGLHPVAQVACTRPNPKTKRACCKEPHERLSLASLLLFKGKIVCFELQKTTWYFCAMVLWKSCPVFSLLYHSIHSHSNSESETSVTLQHSRFHICSSWSELRGIRCCTLTLFRYLLMLSSKRVFRCVVLTALRLLGEI